MKKMSKALYRSISLFALAALFAAVSSTVPQALAQKRKRTTATTAASSNTTKKSLTVQTEPNAIVWIDEIRRGTTDASGNLTTKGFSAGRHILRVRAKGFRETAIPWIPGRGNSLKVRLVPTTDEAELTFQEAEEAREKAKDDEARQKAAELYRRAIALRSAFPAAHVGLARVLLDLNDYKGAFAEIEAARRARPIYPEASAVEGRIQRAAAFEDAAIESYRRAIREARGFQPEAHTGLAIVYDDKGMYAEAVAELRTAIAQLSDTEPVLYQLLGSIYEKMEKYKEAVAAYEKYLQLAPEGNLAPAVRSIMDQLRRQAEEQETSPAQP